MAADAGDQRPQCPSGTDVFNDTDDIAEFDDRIAGGVEAVDAGAPPEVDEDPPAGPAGHDAGCGPEPVEVESLRVRGGSVVSPVSADPPGVPVGSHESHTGQR